MYEPRKTGITRRGTPHATCADWTRRVAQLQARWDEVPPLSAREIGLRMGISRSAAIGKAHRTGLPSRSSPIRRVDRVVVVSALKPPVAALPPLASVVSVAPVVASVEVICGLDDTMAASTDVACGLDDEGEKKASTGPVVFYEPLGKHECWLPLWSQRQAGWPLLSRSGGGEGPLLRGAQEGVLHPAPIAAGSGRVSVSLLQGDAAARLCELPDGIVNVCVTSPPYFNLRNNQGGDAEIGREANLDDYIRRIVEALREVRKVLRGDGSLWLVMGDCYAQGGSGGQSQSSTLRGNGHGGDKPLSPSLQTLELCHDYQASCFTL